MQVGDIYRNREQPDVKARIICLGEDEITVLVEGYAASDVYRAERFNDEWEVCDGDEETQLDRSSDPENEKEGNVR